MTTIYKGYTFTSLASQSDDGRYLARVAIMSLDGSRTRSQRFLDLERYRTREEADARAREAAIAWIDANQQPDPIALPSRFMPPF